MALVATRRMLQDLRQVYKRLERIHIRDDDCHMRWGRKEQEVEQQKEEVHELSILYPQQAAYQ